MAILLGDAIVEWDTFEKKQLVYCSKTIRPPLEPSFSAAKERSHVESNRENYRRVDAPPSLLV